MNLDTEILQVWDTHLQITYLTEDLCLEYIKINHNSIIRTRSNKIRAEDLNQYFIKEGIQMSNTHTIK